MEPFKTHTGKVYRLDRADVDTDQIIPKQFLKRVERTGFGEFLFYDWVKSGEIELDPEASILVAGRNFGCGSSREHAPWALQDFGFKVIVAPSFADIFYSNCTKIGLLPAILDQEDIDQIANADELTVDLEAETVIDESEDIKFDIESHIKEKVLKGHDDIALTLQHEDAISEYEKTQS